MVKKYSITEARDHFSRVVHEAEEGTRIDLTRRGKLVAVLIGVEDFERMAKRTPSFREAYENFRREYDLEELNIDPDKVWGDVRDPSPGGNFEW